jgi:phosphotransferase system  glucose/maltose/N-acetylglucosamine-specific IIC component
VKQSRPTGSVARPGDRPKGRYRFSDRFIKRATTTLLVAMGVIVVAGFVLGFVSDGVSGEAGEQLANTAIVVVVAGFVLPLLIAAILGGESLKRGAGVIGFGLIVGLLLVATTLAESTRAFYGSWAVAAFWVGVALLVLGVVGFWLVGSAARVPMWLQLPFIGSPRVYTQGESERPGDANVGRRKSSKR